MKQYLIYLIFHIVRKRYFRHRISSNRNYGVYYLFKTGFKWMFSFFSSATFINKYHLCFIFFFITVEFICWFLFSQDILYDIIGNIPMVTFIRLVSLLVQLLSVFLKRNNGRCSFEHFFFFFFFAQTRREQIQIIFRFHKLKESIFTYNPMWVFFRKIVKS